MRKKSLIATSKNKVCEAALSGIVRPDLRLVGKWLLRNQIHQIGYHRQKVHCLKTRVGGEEAFNDMLRVIGSADIPTPSALPNQYETKPIDKIAEGFATTDLALFSEDAPDLALEPLSSTWNNTNTFTTAAAATSIAPSTANGQLSKENHELVSYVLNVGAEIEAKCLQILEAARLWNLWCHENLFCQNPERQPIQYLLEGNPVPAHCQVKGWRILSADRKRQRYTKKAVQRWMNYMAEKTGGIWNAEVTVESFYDALEDGGMFCTIGGSSKEIGFNILSGRRNHFTHTDAISIPAGAYDQTYNFRRYDTDLILPDEIIECPLPRVVVFECPELNLRAVMFIVRHPSERHKKRGARFFEPIPTLSGELSEPKSLQRLDDAEELTSASADSTEAVVEEIVDVVPQMKREPLDEEQPFSYHHVASETGKVGGAGNSPPDGHWRIPVSGDLDHAVNATESLTNLCDWSSEPAGFLPKTGEVCWFDDAALHSDLDAENAFGDAIFTAAAAATHQPAKRQRTVYNYGIESL